MKSVNAAGLLTASLMIAGCGRTPATAIGCEPEHNPRLETILSEWRSLVNNATGIQVQVSDLDDGCVASITTGELSSLPGEYWFSISLRTEPDADAATGTKTEVLAAWRSDSPGSSGDGVAEDVERRLGEQTPGATVECSRAVNCIAWAAVGTYSFNMHVHTHAQLDSIDAAQQDAALELAGHNAASLLQLLVDDEAA